MPCTLRGSLKAGPDFTPHASREGPRREHVREGGVPYLGPLDSRLVHEPTLGCLLLTHFHGGRIFYLFSAQEKQIMPQPSLKGLVIL